MWLERPDLGCQGPQLLWTYPLPLKDQNLPARLGLACWGPPDTSVSERTCCMPGELVETSEAAIILADIT